MNKNLIKFLLSGSIIAMTAVPVYAGNNDLGPDGKVKPAEKYRVIQENKIEYSYDKPIVVITGVEYINIDILEDISLESMLDENKENITVKKGDKEYTINFAEKGINPINKYGKIFIPMKETFDEIGIKYMYNGNNILLDNDEIKLDLAYKNLNIKNSLYIKPYSDKKIRINKNHIKSDKKELKNKELSGLVAIMNGNEYINTSIFDRICLEVEKDGEQIIKVINNKNNKYIEISKIKNNNTVNSNFLPIKELFKELDISFSINGKSIEINNNNIKENFDINYIK